MSLKRLALWGSGALVLAVMVLVPALLAGVRMFAVQTPSMGQVAPVGTLVITTPRPAYRDGDIISFTAGAVNHTHRIVRVQEDGSFITKGDLNSVADPLPALPSAVIGQVVVILPGIGWLIQGLPWLLVGSLVVHLISLIGRLPHHRQVATRISGMTLVFCLVVLWFRPWLNVNMLGFTPAPDGDGIRMHIVNTGLFPLDALGTHITSGQDTVVHIAKAAADGRFQFTPLPALEWWQMVLIGLMCLGPLVASLVIKVEEQPGRHHRPVRRPVATVVAIVIATTLVVIGFTLPKAFASTIAKVTDTTSTAGSRTFFKCRNALPSLGASSTFVAFALGTTGTTDTDLSGNARTGRYNATAAVSTSIGCLRDTPARSVTFNGTTQCLYMNSATNTSQVTPNTFSVEAWFRTPNKSNGKIIGFGDVRTTVLDNVYDRQIYLDKDGRIVFGVYNGAIRLAYTAAGTNYANNAWHHVVGTLSTSGQKLYVDGNLIMTNATVTTAETNTGYWKVGCGKLTNWQNAVTYAAGSTTQDYSGPSYFTGQLQYAAVYTVALTAAQAKEHYLAGAT